MIDPYMVEVGERVKRRRRERNRIIIRKRNQKRGARGIRYRGF